MSCGNFLAFTGEGRLRMPHYVLFQTQAGTWVEQPLTFCKLAGELPHMKEPKTLLWFNLTVHCSVVKIRLSGYCHCTPYSLLVKAFKFPCDIYIHVSGDMAELFVYVWPSCLLHVPVTNKQMICLCLLFSESETKTEASRWSSKVQEISAGSAF